jgi:DNA-nicking Smr family endonuclease
MARRSGRTGRGRSPREETAAKGALNAPFADLGKRLRRLDGTSVRTSPPAPPVGRRVVPSPPAPPDEPDLFTSAMAGVVRIAQGPRSRIDPPTPSATRERRLISEEAEALAALSDLVNGASEFDITDTREYVEGAIVGLDPRLLRRLRRGDFSWQAYLDLHGLTADEARPAVDRFLADAVRAGLRCVLLVHGRGLNSKDQMPVLKERLKTWLARGRAAHAVLAFTSARPCDGGAGALYVLLRRDRRRRPIRVTEGAKQ